MGKKKKIDLGKSVLFFIPRTVIMLSSGIIYPRLLLFFFFLQFNDIEFHNTL